MTFREFADFVKQSARMVGQTFTKAKDDWEMTALIDTREGLTIMSNAGADKYAFRDAVLSQAGSATKVAMIHSAWMVKRLPEGVNLDEVRPSEHPDRTEALVVTVFDSEIVEVWTAEISRDGERAPELGEWESLGGPATIAGEMIDPVREALR